MRHASRAIGVLVVVAMLRVAAIAGASVEPIVPPSRAAAASIDSSAIDRVEVPDAARSQDAEPRRLRPRSGRPNGAPGAGAPALPAWARSSWLFRRALESPIALVGGHVVDVRTGDVRTDAIVVIAGDEIRSVESGPDATVPPGARVIELGGAYVVPGLIDLHAHVIPTHPAFPAALAPDAAFRRLLEHGVTTIRLLPLAGEQVQSWHAAIVAGELLGPTIVPASPAFEREPQRTSFGFGDAETARRWVRREALLGARWIKVYNRMDEASLVAIVETAHELGLRVCGHAADVPPHRASALGIDSIEHVTGIPLSCAAPAGESPTDAAPNAAPDAAPAAAPRRGGLFDRVAAGWARVDDERAASLMATFRANGTAWVPTLAVTERVVALGAHDGRPTGVDPDRLRAAIRRAARLAVDQHRAGGLVGLGTDFPIDGVVPGSSAHRELELFVVEGGATPAEALRIGTLDSARILGLDGILGAVEPGLLADLVVLDRDPTADVRAFDSIRFVVHQGRPFEPTDERPARAPAR